MSQIVMKLQGGLGNQLFQYAYALKMHRLFPEKQIVLDTSYYKRKHIRTLELQKLTIPDTVVWSDRERPVAEALYFWFRLRKNQMEKRGKHLRSVPMLEKNGYYFNYSWSDYWTPPKKIRNMVLAGYFQNETQIREVKEELRNTVVPQRELSPELKRVLLRMENTDSVAVSIRAGQDYTDMGWTVCKKEYYIKGIKEIETDQKKHTYFVFSDCIDLVESERWFADYDVEYVKDYEPAEGLFLLSKCKDFVIANSTFSWWGANLGEAERKRVIAPEYFIGTTRTRDGGLHVPGFRYLDNQTGMLCGEER